VKIKKDIEKTKKCYKNIKNEKKATERKKTKARSTFVSSLFPFSRSTDVLLTETNMCLHPVLLDEANL